MFPLLASVWVLAASCLVVWVLSLITREYSWVDRLWSIIPVVYVWIFAGAAGFTDLRLTLMALVVTLWGARLTFNFSRKGGYARGGEDYRWGILRRRMPAPAFQVFNLLFITLFQSVVLWLISMPAYLAFVHRATPFGVWDVLLLVLFVAALAGETISDGQQWRFHRQKHAALAAGRPAPDFLTTGLFRLSRHPNYFFELAQWYLFFGIGALSAGSVLQWPAAGPLLLTVVFIGSTIFTESISRSKYPAYDGYRRTTSALVPWFPRRTSAGAAAATD
jgi:steroid 5-alpha reductase family enzyme